MKQNEVKINEIFASVQGEGLNVGIPMVFIRFHGCSMGCSFCDTKYSWDNENYNLYSVKKIIELIKNNYSGYNWICLTGGEPLEQDILPLCLKLVELGYKVALETNGSIFNREVAEVIDWITIAPKKGGVAEEWFGDLVDKCFVSEMKFVVSSHEEIQKLNYKKIRVPKFLQPCSGTKEAIKAVNEYVTRYPASGFRVGYQLHKLYNIQ